EFLSNSSGELVIVGDFEPEQMEKTIESMLAGLTVVYAGGLAWLALFVPAPKLLAAGLTPFLLGDVVKVLLVATLLSGLSRLKGRDQ
uniref:biotin transporter BioY n=1 Tax=uncultured Sulfitobacter sp. TaxID=191468 RepID=UPI002591F753